MIFDTKEKSNDKEQTSMTARQPAQRGGAKIPIPTKSYFSITGTPVVQRLVDEPPNPQKTQDDKPLAQEGVWEALSNKREENLLSKMEWQRQWIPLYKAGIGKSKSNENIYLGFAALKTNAAIARDLYAIYAVRNRIALDSGFDMRERGQKAPQRKLERIQSLSASPLSNNKKQALKDVAKFKEKFQAGPWLPGQVLGAIAATSTPASDTAAPAMASPASAPGAAAPVATPPNPVATTPEPVATPPEPVVTPPEPVATPQKPVVTPPEPVAGTAASLEKAPLPPASDAATPALESERKSIIEPRAIVRLYQKAGEISNAARLECAQTQALISHEGGSEHAASPLSLGMDVGVNLSKTMKGNVGPAVSSVTVYREGQPLATFRQVNDPLGRMPKKLHPEIYRGIVSMDPRIYQSYLRQTTGAASHAEVYAANKALIFAEMIGGQCSMCGAIVKTQTLNAQGRGEAFAQCPHCRAILMPLNETEIFPKPLWQSPQPVEENRTQPKKAASPSPGNPGRAAGSQDHRDFATLLIA